MFTKRSKEDFLVTALVGQGSSKGSSWFGRAGDIVRRPPWWAAVAGLLALSGRRGRRAATRGGAAYIGAAMLHLPIKLIVDRRHPPGASRIAKIGPIAPSFPSGHAASDLAFTLAASQELPALLLPLSAATLAAHWSLVRTRSHYPSDVFAGGVLAVIVTLALWKLWPTGGGTDEDELRSEEPLS